MYIRSVFSSSKCSLFNNSNVFGSCIIHILFIGCAKIKKKTYSGAKMLKYRGYQLADNHSQFLDPTWNVATVRGVCALAVTAKAVQGNECGISEMGSCWYQCLLTNLLVSKLRECEGLRTHTHTPKRKSDTGNKGSTGFVFKHWIQTTTFQCG